MTMKRQLFGVAAALSVLLLAAGAEAQKGSSPNDIVSFVPAGPILLPGIKFPYFNPDQLTGGNPADMMAIEQVWALYVFYHDTHDGERFASLFTPDGVFDQELNQNGTFIPNSGVDAKGCVLRGRAQIANFINLETKNAPPLTFPRASHKVTSPLIKVDGDEAAMIAPYFGLGGGERAGGGGERAAGAAGGDGRPPAATGGGARAAGSGGGIYMVKFKKNAQGWQIQGEHLVYDRPKMNQNICDLNGTIPPPR
jgi:hypothetical protein